MFRLFAPSNGFFSRCGKVARRVREVATDRSGNVMMIVAFSIIPLIGAVGIATDTARGYLIKSRLQSAVDAAALAGGRVYYDDTRNADIQQYFSANFPSGYMDATLSPLTINEDVPNETINLSAQAVIPTTFMRLLGADTMTVSATAQVTRKTDRLHVVLAIDMSGSMRTVMENGQSRIENAKNAALTLTNNLFGTNAANDLLRIGIVPWAGKVNVTNGSAYTSYSPVDVSSFTHPVPFFTNPASPYQTYSSDAAYPWEYISPNAGLTQSKIYYANNSEVPLLDIPPTDWSGCVYARFVGDDSTAADLKLGPATVGGKSWLGWVPTGSDIATRTAPYDVSSGGGVLVNGLFGVAMTGATSGNPVNMVIAGTFTLPKKTGQTWYSGTTIYWDDVNKVATSSSTTVVSQNNVGTTYSIGDLSLDQSKSFRTVWYCYYCGGGGTTVNNTKIGTSTGYVYSSTATGQVTLLVGRGGDPQSNTNDYYNDYPNNVCLDTHANRNSTSSSSRTSDCTPCPQSGITPLTSTKSDVVDAINALSIPSTASDTDYYTNIPQGMAWAWEVLMPTAPFTEGALADPSEQAPPRAIVLLTDGFNTCRQGDAYQNYYDSSDGCVTWRDNRLTTLASTIKSQGVYVYTIQYAECDASTVDLLKAAATKPQAPYYFCAPTADELDSAFTEIANDLSNLRLSR